MEAVLTELVKSILKEDMEKNIKDAYIKFKKSPEYDTFMSNLVKSELSKLLSTYLDTMFISEKIRVLFEGLLCELIKEDNSFRSKIKKSLKSYYFTNEAKDSMLHDIMGDEVAYHHITDYLDKIVSSGLKLAYKKIEKVLDKENK